jgi:hypothetical protein
MLTAEDAESAEKGDRKTQRSLCPLRFKILKFASLGRTAGVHCIVLFSYS